MKKEQLFATLITKEQLDNPNIDVLQIAMEGAVARIGWECLSCPHEAFQWVGTDLQEREDGGLNIFINVLREDKENPEYDERTKEEA